MFCTGTLFCVTFPSYRKEKVLGILGSGDCRIPQISPTTTKLLRRTFTRLPTFKTQRIQYIYGFRFITKMVYEYMY